MPFGAGMTDYVDLKTNASGLILPKDRSTQDVTRKRVKDLFCT